MKAVIGINVDIQGTNPKIAKVQANYYEAVSKAGAIPLLIPPSSDEDLAEILKRIDGVLFIGGLDYCPSVYGEDCHESVQLAHDDRRDFDYKLLKASLAQSRLPLLGICAGCQILNIGLGGSLYQDIPSDFPESKVMHSSEDGWTNGFHHHRVRLKAGSKLAQIYAEQEFDVPTSHHQAVKKLGQGLLAAADAEDGIIEAVELQDRAFVIGVQWHPERDYEGNKALFQAFVQACTAAS
ncbi:MAG: gamma-glutamyl-gamma-aminobutyrate hydrolase family protein [Candidatus Obscuribacterales bacterium]|nr:gamma-glutamyl-gamma-aminobutyrate hydrolase family protein [Candidatus Obscuribacterales bacterium]